jgi:hypothetical protein
MTWRSLIYLALGRGGDMLKRTRRVERGLEGAAERAVNLAELPRDAALRYTPVHAGAFDGARRVVGLGYWRWSCWQRWALAVRCGRSAIERPGRHARAMRTRAATLELCVTDPTPASPLLLLLGEARSRVVHVGTVSLPNITPLCLVTSTVIPLNMWSFAQTIHH